jgi:ATP-dependent RNA helicase DOB1
MYFELLKRFDGGKSIPLMDPISDLEIESNTLKKLTEAKTTIQTELKST